MVLCTLKLTLSPFVMTIFFTAAKKRFRLGLCWFCGKSVLDQMPVNLVPVIPKRTSWIAYLVLLATFSTLP